MATEPQVRWRAANGANDYYSVTVPGDTALVSVVHTRFDTFVCLTCHSCSCDHAKAVEASDQLKPRPPVT